MLAGATVTETTGIPVPLNPTVVALPVEELLVITRLPLMSPAPPGVKLTFNTIDWPGSNVTGRVAPVTERPAPLAVAAEIVTGRSPLEVKVRGRVESPPMATFPKDRLSGLTLSVGTVEASCSVKLFEAPPPVAVNVTVCAVDTGKKAAVKLAVLDPCGTPTVTGTTTAAELLARLTLWATADTAELKVTLHATWPAPLTEEVAQLTPETEGVD